MARTRPAIASHHCYPGSWRARTRLKACAASQSDATRASPAADRFRLTGRTARPGTTATTSLPVVRPGSAPHDTQRRSGFFRVLANLHQQASIRSPIVNATAARHTSAHRRVGRRSAGPAMRVAAQMPAPRTGTHNDPCYCSALTC